MQMLAIFVFQLIFIPYIFSRSICDLFGPWYIVLCVYNPRWIALTLGVIGAYVLETHSTLPAFFFLANFLIIGLLIAQIKSKISWRSPTPWVSVFCISSLWLSLSEIFIVAVKIGISSIDILDETTVIISRALIALGFGYSLVYKQLDDSLEEAKN